MVSEAVAPQLQPFLLEMRQLFAAQEKRSDNHDRRFDEQDRKLDALTEVVTKLTHTVAAQGEKLAEHDRKLDVIVARLDGLKVLGHVLLGTLALLITALIAVFGFLFTS